MIVKCFNTCHQWWQVKSYDGKILISVKRATVQKWPQWLFRLLDTRIIAVSEALEENECLYKTLI